MSIKSLIETIKKDGILRASGTLEELYKLATENESRLTALTSQLESVVAENAALLKFIKDDCYVYTNDSCEPVDANTRKPETPATDAFLAEVRASAIPDEATERDLFEEWVMEKIFISKTTLEGLRTDDGYRNSTLSGRDYNGMWSQWKSIRAAQLRQVGAQ
ncbi:hypothetical protein [Lelliottia amnigena]|uniref:hypothetical protein n=1 Tax=Lelliottia amnigena TaxID=61646 RepID=UPI00301ABD9D